MTLHHFPVPLAAAASALLSPALAAAAPDFQREIRPILSNYCFQCHGPDEKERKGGTDGLRLDTVEGAFADLGGYKAIVPGKPEESELIKRLVTDDADEAMPPRKSGKKLTEREVTLLREWVKDGAKFANHWSYEKPVRPAVPEVGAQSPVPGAQSKNGAQGGPPGVSPIDAFLLARLAKEKLAPSPEADRHTLVRRVALDLTGLPPTLEEVNAFVNDPSPVAYSRMVDRFLASPAYGEHWAWQWLDLARYADSAGYPSDPGREIWAYRDWVIRALNANMPFDQFTIEQLAGDLLPNPTEDQLIATAFHRNTMTQNEGGTNDEEFRTAAVIDRVNTTFAVWMGTTMACAQCHTHKYDPITIKEYFQFYDFLNQSADADRKDESPLHSFDTPETRERREKLRNEIASLEGKFANPSADWLKGFDGWARTFASDLRWHTPKPEKIEAPAASVQEDGRVWVGKTLDTATYLAEVPLEGEQLSALRIETEPRPGFGNFVLTGLKAEIVASGAEPSRKARFVRVELPGEKKILQLAEVQIFSGAENVALKGNASQSSTSSDGAGANRAHDGNTDGNYLNASVTHGRENEKDPWWELDLTDTKAVDRVVVWNRTDGGTGTRLEGFRVVLLDEARRTVWASGPTAAPATEKAFEIGQPVKLTFSTAVSDHEQTGFEAAKFLQPKSKGWAIGGATDRPHALTLLASSPTLIPAGAKLRVTLEQKSGFKQHTMGAFRIGFTGDPRIAQAVSVPSPVLAALSAGNRTPEQQKTATDYYVRNVAKESAAERNRLAAAQKELAAVKPVTVPIMRDLDAKERRKTHVQLRGNWQALGEEVTAGTPAVFPPLPAEAPRNRLTMAKWLVSRENPLTARVAVNRMWEAIFGVGIVRSSEEFGSQGDMPVHPELLDWLAVEFVESGWNVKHMLALMFNSRAYRQISTSTVAMNERDPDNRLLARGPRFRPPGELLRDQALAVSGLLSGKMFGPPARPMRPALGLNIAFGGSNDWTTSAGEDRHRRSVYTEVKRTSPYPSFAIFDAPNREVCTIRRGRSNTPLQAFVTLNDPVFVEAHQALARRLLAEPGDPAARIRRAFQICVARDPDARDLATLTGVLEKALALYRSDAALATKMATDPLGPAPKDADVATLAAWTTVASVVMNLDEFLMRR